MVICFQEAWIRGPPYLAKPGYVSKPDNQTSRSWPTRTWLEVSRVTKQLRIRTLQGLHGPPVVWLHGPKKGRLAKAIAAAAALSSSPVTFSCFLFHKYMYTSSTGWNCRVCRCIPSVPYRSALALALSCPRRATVPSSPSPAHSVHRGPVDLVHGTGPWPVHHAGRPQPAAWPSTRPLPVNPGDFAEKPPPLPEINPRSYIV